MFSTTNCLVEIDFKTGNPAGFYFLWHLEAGNFHYVFLITKDMEFSKPGGKVDG